MEWGCIGTLEPNGSRCSELKKSIMRTENILQFAVLKFCKDLQVMARVRFGQSRKHGNWLINVGDFFY